MKNNKDRVLHTFYTESQLKILKLLWDKGPLSVEDITNELHMSPEQVRRELEELESRYIVDKRILYFATLSKDDAIHVCEIAKKYSSKCLTLLEIEAEERKKRELKKFAQKAYFD